MASRSLNDLHPSVREKARGMIGECEKQGITLLVYCTYRSPEEQTALYAQGRNPVVVVNQLRKNIGLSPITEESNKIVTRAKAGKSYHEYKCAFDAVPLESGKPVWNEKNPVWKKVGAIGKKFGLEWAGDWKVFVEFPHFQYTGGLTILDLAQGLIPA